MDSLKKRYLYKLSSNSIGMVVGLATQAIIPRGLGPKTYGDYTFLTNFFTEVVNFLNMGTSFGFYTKLSQRQNEPTLASSYIYFSGLLFFISIGLILLVHMSSLAGLFWPDQNIGFVYASAIWGFLTWFAMVFTLMGDAYGLTVTMESIRVIQKILGLAIVACLFIFNWLNFTTVISAQYFIWSSLIVSLFLMMEHKGFSLGKSWRISKVEIRRYFTEYYLYSHPLFVYALVGLIVGIFDRWLLQLFCGSRIQGFYGLSYQIGSFCFLFTNAMTPLLTREFSVTFAEKDFKRMAYLFRRYIPSLFFIAAFFSCFISVNAEAIIYFIAGPEYAGALVALSLMAFYPIHQTYGQLSGSVFYATEQTKLYRNIGIFFKLIGLPITYLVVAPKEKMGLNAGATGLAMKMVLIQCLAVNVQLYFNSRFLGLNFWKYIGHQFLSIGLLLVLACIAKFIVENTLACGSNMLICFLISGFLYTLAVAMMIYFWPVIIGLGREDIDLLVNRSVQRIFSR